MNRKLINEDINCDNDIVNATTKEGDEIYANYEDADARPFVLFNYEGETVFLLGDYGQWHKEILSDWIMSNIITPILKEWAEAELNDCNVQIENAIEELNSDYPREAWEDIELENLCDCGYYHLCTQALENYIDDALDGEANDIGSYFVDKETMYYEIGEMYDFEYDSNEEDFYVRSGDPQLFILRFLREYTDIGDICDALYKCGAISYGRIWDRMRVIGLAYYVDSYDMDETIRFISHESGIPYEDLLTYHIGYSAMPYLVTVKEMIDGESEDYDDYDHVKTPPVIHNMNAKDKWNSDQIQGYLSTKNKKYGDIEAAMRKMGKPDAMAYYNSLKTQESKSLGREIIISEKQLERILTEEVVADGNAEHNPYSKRWKMEREALINYIVNYGQIMTSKENGKEYKVLYDTMLSQYLGLNFCACVQWNPLDMTPGNIVYVRAYDKFTKRRFKPQFDARGMDNTSGTADDTFMPTEGIKLLGAKLQKLLA